MSRTYDMTRRAGEAARTRERIVDAAERLLASRPVAVVTLQAVADEAGVTVQTVLRHFGSRDGCIAAVAGRVRPRIEEQRGSSAPGDVAGALDGLCTHYETDGRLILNLLAQEGTDPFAAGTVAEGRAYHRAWVERCLASGDDELVDALVAATDLYVWRLLRLDLGRSAAATRATIGRMVEALLATGGIR